MRELESVTVGDAGVEVLHLVQRSGIAQTVGLAEFVGKHVGKTPVETEGEGVVIVVLCTHAATQTGVKALDITETAIGLAEETHADVVDRVIVKVEDTLSIYSESKVRTEVGINTQEVAEVVAITHVEGNLDITCTGLQGTTGSIGFSPLHGVVEAEVYKDTLAVGQHILAANTCVERGLHAGVNEGTAEVAHVKTEKTLEGKAGFWFILQSAGTGGKTCQENDESE